MASHLVNWLSPLKERVTVVTGERGAFVADTLHGDLTFHENGVVADRVGPGLDVPRRHRGQQHPVRDPEARAAAGAARELPRRRARAGRTTSSRCGRAWPPSPWPTPASSSAREGAPSTVEPRRHRMKIAVVGLGKIGLPLAAQFADAGPSTSSASTSTPRPSTQVNAGTRALPRRGATWPSTCTRLVPAGAAAGHDRLRRGDPRRRRRRGRRAALRRRRRAARLRLDGQRHARHRARTSTPGTLVIYETTLPVGTTRDAVEARARSR